MAISLEALREAPAAAALAQVYADHLLEVGDVRGALVQAQLAGAKADVEAWLTEHQAGLFAQLGTPEAVRLCGGFVRQVVHHETITRLSPAALTREPLATLVTTIASAAELSHLEQLLGVQLFGLDLTVQSEAVELVKTVRRMPVVALRVGDALGPWLERVDFPALRVLATPSLSAVARARPFSRTVRWLSLRSAEAIADVLEWPQLELLDLRGVKLTRPQRARLQRWQNANRTVLHETMTLDDRTTFATVFSAEGRWVARAPARRRLGVSATERYVSVTDDLARGYVDGDPAWEVRLPAPIVRVHGTEAGYELDCENGERLTLDPRSGRAQPTRRTPPVAEGPLEAHAGDRVARVEDGVVRLKDGAAQLLAEWNLGPGVEALVATATGFAAATTQHVWHLVAGKAPKLILEDLQGVRALLASGNAWLAASLSLQQVSLTRPEGRKTQLCTWTRTFSVADGGALEVHDLAVEPSGRALVALSDGALNVLDGDSGQAFKPLEFEGQPYRHWVFIFGGNMLVSD